jgi:hypothetical protein
VVAAAPPGATPGGRAPFALPPRRSRGLLALALVWLVLFAAYVATIGLSTDGREEYAGNEPHNLLTAVSIVEDGDVDLTNQYRTRAWEAFSDRPVTPRGKLTDGRLHEPQGAGFPLLIAPAYAIGGAVGVEVFLAAVAALAFTLAVALARRIVPDPWATVAPLVVGLSPPALAASTAVYPDMAAGALLAAAALLALAGRERPQLRTAVICALCIGALPWLGPKYALAGLAVLVWAIRWLRRRGRPLAVMVAAELPIASVFLFVSINGALFGGLTPYAAEARGGSPTGADSVADYLERAERLVSLGFDRDVGLVRWAPVVLLAVLGAWLLWRSYRDRVARALPGQHDTEAAAAVCVSICAAQLLVATFLAPTIDGEWFAGRHMVAAAPAAAALAAWGMRHAPRFGAAMAALTLAGSVWVYADLRFGDGSWTHPPDAPLGPLVDVLPRWSDGGAGPVALTAAVVLGLVALAVSEAARRRPPRTSRPR